MSNLVKYFASLSLSIMSEINGRGYAFLTIQSLRYL